MFFTAKQKSWNTRAVSRAGSCSYSVYEYPPSFDRVESVKTWSYRVKYQTFIIVFYSLGFFFTLVWFWKPYFYRTAYLLLAVLCKCNSCYFQVNLLTTLGNYACSCFQSQTLKMHLVPCLSLLASCFHFSLNPSVHHSQLCAFPVVCMWSFCSICNLSLLTLSSVLLFICRDLSRYGPCFVIYLGCSSSRKRTH